MEVIKSHDFREGGEQANEVLRLHDKELGENERKYLKVREKRAKTLKIIEGLTGLKFDVFRKGEAHVAAFITVAGKETYIAEHTLDDPVWAAYAAYHEAMHKKTSNFMTMGKHAFIKHDYFEAVNEELKGTDVQLGEFNVCEGFTDALTADAHGEHANSGYNHHEVPAAEKLEELCTEMTGASLMEAFKSNDVALFHLRLERLGEVLLMRKAFDDFAKQDEELEEMRPQVLEKIQVLKPIVTTTEEAERFVGKIVAECVALERVEGYFRRDENLSSVSASAGMLS